MNGTKLNPWVIAGAAAAVGLTVAAAAVYADRGLPNPGALSYVGTLEDGAGLIDGLVDIDIALYDSASMNEQYCRDSFTDVTVSAGRFQVELTETCTAVVESHDNVYVAVSVDPGDGALRTFPPQRLHAAPYAVRAREAHNGVPLGTVIDWWRPDASTEPPAGWVPCDGSTILDGPLAGKVLPDLTGSFTRGEAAADIPAAGFKQGGADFVDLTHNHQWARFEDTAGPNSWFSYDADGTELLVVEWDDGIDAAGSTADMPLSIRDAAGVPQSKTYHTTNGGAAMHDNRPAYVGLIKLCRVN